MKKSIVVLVCFLVGIVSYGQQFKGLDKSPMDVAAFPKSYKNSDKVVKVTYSRPQLKGRTVESLAKPGVVWRTGANESTEIQFYKDVVFGGKKVAAGTYSLFTIPGEKEWTVILNSDLNDWGAYSYNKEHDVVRVKAKVSEVKESLDAFSIAFDDDMNLYIGWGTTKVIVPIK